MLQEFKVLKIQMIQKKKKGKLLVSLDHCQSKIQVVSVPKNNSKNTFLEICPMHNNLTKGWQWWWCWNSFTGVRD